MSLNKQNTLFADRYILLELIGTGGFSEVWMAKDTKADDAIVAVKIYAPDKGLDEYGAKQFRQEYGITHSLSHPHLMKVSYFDIADNSPYLIMPYYEQGSLATLLKKGQTFTEKQAALLMHQIGSAIAEMHQQMPPVLHMDIKPDNILVRNDEFFVLTDFGISSKARHTLQKTVIPKQLTIAYSPPERFAQDPIRSEAGDIFSFGVTLYEMCTGNVPWDGYGGQSLLKGAQLPKLPAEFSKSLNGIMHACMNNEWHSRPTAREISNWGKHFLEKGYWKLGFSAEPAKKLNPKVMYIGGGITVAAAVVGLLIWLNPFAKSKAATDNIVYDTASVAIPDPLASPDTQAVADGFYTEKDSAMVTSDTLIATNNQPVDNSVSANTDNLSDWDQPATDAGNKKVTESPSFKKPASLTEYLNQLSNNKIPRKVRKQWKEEALQYFNAKKAVVYDKESDVGTQYTPEHLLTLLMDIPQKVTVLETLKDPNDKIVELHIQMTPK